MRPPWSLTGEINPWHVSLQSHQDSRQRDPCHCDMTTDVPSWISLSVGIHASTSLHSCGRIVDSLYRKAIHLKVSSSWYAYACLRFTCLYRRLTINRTSVTIHRRYSGSMSWQPGWARHRITALQRPWTLQIMSCTLTLGTLALTFSDVWRVINASTVHWFVFLQLLPLYFYTNEQMHNSLYKSWLYIKGNLH